MTKSFVRSTLALTLTGAFLGLAACGGGDDGNNAGLQTSAELDAERAAADAAARARAAQAERDRAAAAAAAADSAATDAQRAAAEAERLAAERRAAVAQAELDFRAAGQCAAVPGRPVIPEPGSNITALVACYPVVKTTCKSSSTEPTATLPADYVAFVYYKEENGSRTFSMLREGDLTPMPSLGFDATPLVAAVKGDGTPASDQRTNTFDGTELAGGNLSTSVAVDYELVTVAYNDGTIGSVSTACKRQGAAL